MTNPPDRDMQGFQPYSGKLILPAPREGSYVHPYNTPPVRPEQLIRRQASAPPPGLFSRLAYFWRTEPIYRVLWLAIVMVIIASIVFIAFGASALLNGNNGPGTQSSVTTQHSSTPTPVSTVKVQATATPTAVPSPTPTLAPTPTPTPSPTATPTPSPTPTVQVALTVQTTAIPPIVQNFTVVHIGVMTNQPGVSVTLQIIYNTQQNPFTSTMTTDNGGNANFSWTVTAFKTGNTAEAMIKVVATNPAGQRAMIQPVIVQITNR